ncbi:GNAT family N-acetyltransferase [Hymenobacter sp. DG25B]|uniref:GNAT family N-acetyltransferase n=1 Tax=Hymenobacter sp. DG25B TaxID=1385664 RepID=UPI0009E23DFD|nr:GNAT family N-acetyltransferase [Hymenobacter sp. DG25B]
MITTPRLQLLPCRPEHFAAMLQPDLPALAQLLHVEPDIDWLQQDLVWEVVSQAAQFLTEHPEAAHWWLYFFIHAEYQQVVGVGGFKGPPTQGTVELGYSIAPHFRQQGYATEATRGMLQFAFDHPEILQVLAHTLPGINYSTQVLAKTGFTFQQVIEDPEDGLVWQWRLLKPDYSV